MKEETRVVDFEVHDEKHAYEDHLIKACTMGHLEVIQEYLERKHRYITSTISIRFLIQYIFLSFAQLY